MKTIHRSAGGTLPCPCGVPGPLPTVQHFHLLRGLVPRPIARSKAWVWYDNDFLHARFDLEEPCISRLQQRKADPPAKLRAGPSQRVWDSDCAEFVLWRPERILLKVIANWTGRWVFLARKLVAANDPVHPNQKLYHWRELTLTLPHDACSVDIRKTAWQVMMKIPWRLLGKKGPRTDLKVLLGRGRYVMDETSSWPGCSHFEDLNCFARLVLAGKKPCQHSDARLLKPQFVQKYRPPARRGWVPSRETVVVRNGGMFPVVQKLQDGSLGLVARFGAGHLGLGARLEFWRSLDEGKSWLPPTVISDGGIRGDHRNPGFGQMQDGTLVVGYCHCEDYDRHGNYVHDRPKNKPFPPIQVRRSVDMGQTWSKPSVLADLGNPGLYSPYGKVVVLPDGTALMAVYGGGSYLVRSHDNGQTWQDLTLISREHGETALLVLGSGKVLAAMRRRDLTLWLTESGDGGFNWSTPRQVTGERQAPADLIQLKTGEIVLTHGNRFVPFGVRALISRDAGRTWQPQQSLRLCWWADNADCGYPSSAEISRDRIFTAYYAVRSRRDPTRGVFAGGLIYRKKDLM